MAKADTWMPFYLADYLRATMRLSTLEHGAYMLLIMAAWESGGRLENRPRTLAGITKLSLAEWEEISSAILPYFRVEGSELVHDRVTEEREKAQRLSDARKEIGQRGGRPKKQKESEQKPIGFDEQNQLPSQTETPSPSPLPSEVIHTLSTAHGVRVDEARQRLDEVRAAAGDALASMATTPGVASLSALTALLSGGEPCDWHLDVLPAVTAAAAWHRQRDGPGSMRSWTVAVRIARENRSNRLNPPPVEPARVRPSAPSGPDPRSAARLERFADFDAASRAALRQNTG